EIGCGTGHLLNEISKYYEAYGVEISNFALNEARRNCPGVKIYNISAEDLSCFQDDFFDGILAKHVFEHLERPETAFRECNRVLKERGMLIFVTPNLKCISRHLKKSDWHGFRDPTHISLKQPEEWVRIITDSGFRIEKTFSDGMWDVPYMPWVPKSIQKIIFGSLGGLQAVLGLSILPVFLGESLIILARKLATEEF
ncbi:MAG: class I SAM-dependent methyltransferase, partial [Candidatus Bathyarchaeia archaeon]